MTLALTITGILINAALFVVFAWQLQKMPLLPLGEPKLEDFLEPHEH